MNTLRKLSGLVALSALVLVAIMLSTRTASANEPTPPSSDYITNYYFGFDTTVKPWIALFNGATNQPGLHLKRVAEGNGCSPLHEGAGYANLSMDNIVSSSADLGGSTNGLNVGTWMMTSIPVIGPSAVTVNYAAASTNNCEGCRPVMYIGQNAPASKDFVVAKEALSTKWQNYTYQEPIFTTGNTIVALGFSKTNAAVGFDCVNIKIESIARPWVESSVK